MKKIILTLGIALMSLFTAQAQTADREAAQTDKLVAEYTDAASLTPDQVAKAKPMFASFVTTRNENKAKYASDAAGMKTANKTNRDNLKAQLKTVLTAEQMQKIEDYQKAKKDRQEKTNQQ